MGGPEVNIMFDGRNSTKFAFPHASKGIQRLDQQILLLISQVGHTISDRNFPLVTSGQLLAEFFLDFPSGHRLTDSASPTTCPLARVLGEDPKLATRLRNVSKLEGRVLTLFLAFTKWSRRRDVLISDRPVAGE
jgi:hypothetical protein